MKKIIAKDYEFDREKLAIYRQWGEIDRCIKKFEGNCTLGVFNFLFEDDGQRLWNHFRLDCDRKFRTFKTYLTDTQYSDLLMNIHLNENMYFL